MKGPNTTSPSHCERGFNNKTTLMHHENTHLGLRPYQCQNCPSNFTRSQELWRHKLYKHSHKKPHHCNECDYTCVEKAKLQRHMRIHTGERPYQCTDCSFAATDKFGLARHWRVHTGEKPFECDICKIGFTQQNSLKTHKDIHYGNKPRFQCTSCPYVVGCKRDLSIHISRIHQPISCQICKGTFIDKYKLKIHKKNHCFNNLKCSICNYSCSNKKRMGEHFLTHSDYKPFGCDLCDKRFRTRQEIKRHQNMHHNPSYKPPINPKTHRCLECGKSFNREQNLARHMIRKHEKEHENRVKQELTEANPHPKSMVQPDLEVGEINTSNQELFLNDLETGEIVDIDGKSQTILLQKIKNKKP